MFTFLCLTLLHLSRRKVILEDEYVGHTSGLKFVEGALHQHWLPSPELTVRSCSFRSDGEKPTLGPRMLFMHLPHGVHNPVNLKQHPSASFRTYHRGESEAFPSLHLLLSPKTLFNGVGHEIEQIVRKRCKGRPNAMKFSYCSVQQWPGDHRWVIHTEQVLTHALRPRNTMLGLFKQSHWWRVSHARTIFKQEVNNKQSDMHSSSLWPVLQQITAHWVAWKSTCLFPYSSLGQSQVLSRAVLLPEAPGNVPFSASRATFLHRWPLRPSITLSTSTVKSPYSAPFPHKDIHEYV